jgi:hypothetical protein
MQALRLTPMTTALCSGDLLLYVTIEAAAL